MADIAMGSVEKIVSITLKIKEAVDTVCQNEECRAIERSALSCRGSGSRWQTTRR